MKLTQLLKEVEEKKTPGAKQEEKDEKAFAKSRFSGAESIANTAKEKVVMQCLRTITST